MQLFQLSFLLICFAVFFCQAIEVEEKAEKIEAVSDSGAAASVAADAPAALTEEKKHSKRSLYEAPLITTYPIHTTVSKWPSYGYGHGYGHAYSYANFHKYDAPAVKIIHPAPTIIKTVPTYSYVPTIKYVSAIAPSYSYPTYYKSYPSYSYNTYPSYSSYPWSNYGYGHSAYGHSGYSHWH